MSKENTCGNCPHLAFGGILGLRTAYCGKTPGDDFIVPHESHLEGGKRGGDTVIRLSRIPPECPRTDVVKSEKPAPRKDWIEVVVPFLK